MVVDAAGRAYISNIGFEIIWRNGDKVGRRNRRGRGVMRVFLVTGGKAGQVALLALGLLLAAMSPANAEPLRLGYESWVAPGPFFIAQEKGWFEEEGVSVELVNIEDVRIRASALATGEVDAITANIDEAVLHLGAEGAMRFVFAIAESRGGDGIIAMSDVEDIAGLTGRTVAVQPGTSRQFYLNALLREAGLSETDIKTVPLAPGEAGLAFERQEVDAAVTWYPWLGRTARMAHGSVLTDTSKQPGLLVETVVAGGELLEARREEFEALYRAWVRAVEWAAENPEDSALIIAKGVGRWMRDEKVVEEMREGIAWYDGEMNGEFFGTAEEPGPITVTVTSAIEIWSGFGKLQTAAKANDLIDRGVVKAEKTEATQP
jgi:NitT/TauT family transport system substrate-binding protein